MDIDYVAPTKKGARSRRQWQILETENAADRKRTPKSAAEIRTDTGKPSAHPKIHPDSKTREKTQETSHVQYPQKK